MPQVRRHRSTLDARRCRFGLKGEGASGAAILGQRRRGSLLVSMQLGSLASKIEIAWWPR